MCTLLQGDADGSTTKGLNPACAFPWAACCCGQSRQDSSCDVKCAPKAGGLPSSEPWLTAAAAAAAEHTRDGSEPQVSALSPPWGSPMRRFGMGGMQARGAGGQEIHSGQTCIRAGLPLLARLLPGFQELLCRSVVK